MPAPLLSKEEVLARIAKVFRANGYGDTSLAELARATGLNKASLYHYFPRGKEQMAEAVLSQAGDFLEANVFSTLTSDDPPEKRAKGFVDAVKKFYANGDEACLLEAFSLGPGHELFSAALASASSHWEHCIKTFLTEQGRSVTFARGVAEQTMIEIQGALVMSRLHDDQNPFKRAMERVYRLLLSTEK